MYKFLIILNQPLIQSTKTDSEIFFVLQNKNVLLMDRCAKNVDCHCNVIQRVVIQTHLAYRQMCVSQVVSVHKVPYLMKFRINVFHWVDAVRININVTYALVEFYIIIFSTFPPQCSHEFCNSPLVQSSDALIPCMR